MPISSRGSPPTVNNTPKASVPQRLSSLPAPWVLSLIAMPRMAMLSGVMVMLLWLTCRVILLRAASVEVW